MAVTLYGIPNCDTLKKARKWLDARGIEYAFHDYKKAGIDPAKLDAWTADKGWEVLLNQRGTTFRKLDEADKTGIDSNKAVTLMAQHTSMIKRPVVEHPGGLLVGFKEDEWDAGFS
jgi:Spx/MgsR family transcriptional regulator